jgi:Cu+-exporting ATPase
MSVDPATATERLEYNGSTYYFCSAGCRSAFAEDPARYTPRATTGTSPSQL